MKTETESRSRTDDLLFESERRAGYERAAYVLMGLLVAYSFVRGIRAAVVRPFWFDELYTLTIAGQPTLRDLWSVGSGVLMRSAAFFPDRTAYADPAGGERSSAATAVNCGV